MRISHRWIPVALVVLACLLFGSQALSRSKKRPRLPRTPSAPVEPERVCGAPDVRYQTNNLAVARLRSAGGNFCTAWITDRPTSDPNNRCMLTAGHCRDLLVPGSIVEFNVPNSNANCTINPSMAQFQFQVDRVVGLENNGLGSDWAAFIPKKNCIAPAASVGTPCVNDAACGVGGQCRTVFQVQGKDLTLVAPAVGDAFKFGDGAAGNSPPPAVPGVDAFCTCHPNVDARAPANLTQQAAQRQITKVAATVDVVEHNIDDCGGDSGEVIMNDSAGGAVAIGTCGGCDPNAGACRLGKGTCVAPATNPGVACTEALCPGANGTFVACECAGAACQNASCCQAASPVPQNGGTNVMKPILQATLAECDVAPAPLHFQCYEVDHAKTNIAVSLVNEFGSSTATLVDVKRLCNPADKNGEAPAAPSDPRHLVGYTLRQTSAHFRPVRNYSVKNQFGTFVVKVVRPIRLFVPSSKDVSSPPPPLDPVSAAFIDHYECYRVTGAPGAGTVAVVDQFGTGQVKLYKGEQLCVPVNKNGSGINNPSAKLLCYKARLASGTLHAPKTPVFVNNQFGPATLQSVKGADQFCVPSSPSGAFLDDGSDVQ